MGGKDGKDEMDGWWERRSLGEKIGLGILFALGGIGLLFLFGWVVMLLWNWLMPEIFGLKRISYWQGWGLLLLSSILFGRMGGSSSGKTDRKRKRELREKLRADGPVPDGEAGGATAAAEEAGAAR
jgi:hypothetical protein